MRLRRLTLSDQRRLIGFGFLGVFAVAVYWNYFTDGLPILWGPSASASEIEEGRELFEHEWTPNDPLAHGDGLGPVFNARSCSACHFQGGVGGGGGTEHNVLSYEILTHLDDPEMRGGVIHNFSTESQLKETFRGLRQLYPILKSRTVVVNNGQCAMPQTIPDFDPVRTEQIQTTALFGVGWLDLISDRAILRNARNRGLRQASHELQLQFDNVPVGRVRHVRGGVGKFGWKAQFATLTEFVAAACANEIGLETPTVAQAKPMSMPNYAVTGPDLDKKQFRSLVGFVKTLPRPVETEPAQTATHGKKLFSTVGCAVCHVPDIGGVKNVYSDFLLYSLEDPPPPGGSDRYDSTPPPELKLPPRPEDEPQPAEWKTPPLWGVADSAPYLHDGSAPTLLAAIQKHGGEASIVREKFKALSATDQAALLSFLGTLKAPPTAAPLSNLAVTKLARR